MYLNITATAGCRGRCIYCPQDEFQTAMRPRPAFLTVEELTSLVPNLRATHFDAWSFGGFSEPMDNPEIVALLTFVGQLEFVDEIWLYTNGEAFTPEVARALDDLPIARVEVSCHGFDPEVYRRTRPFIDATTVAANLRYLFAHRDNIVRLAVSVTGPFGSDEELEALERECEVAGAVFERRALHSRAGLLTVGRSAPGPQHGPFRCRKFDFEKPVLIPGGDVSLCCQDFALHDILGNLHQQTFAEIMASPLRRHVLSVAAGVRDDPALACYQCVFCEPRSAASRLAATSLDVKGRPLQWRG